jgi:2'-5' RNA ligase
MDNSNPRIFLALKFTLTSKNLNFIDKLKNTLADSKIRWVPNDNYHLTLKFFGETPSYFIKSIEILVQQALRELSTFNLKLKGLGTLETTNQKLSGWV